MKRLPWEKEYQAKMEYSNDANDFYYEWVDLEVEDNNDEIETIQDLFEKYFDVGIHNEPKVVIKARKNSIFIYLKEEVKKEVTHCINPHEITYRGCFKCEFLNTCNAEEKEEVKEK